MILSPVVPAVNVPTPSPRLCFVAGWDAYVRRRPYAAMADDNMRAGRRSAQKAEQASVDQETAAYLAEAATYSAKAGW